MDYGLKGALDMSIKELEVFGDLILLICQYAGEWEV